MLTTLHFHLLPINAEKLKNQVYDVIVQKIAEARAHHDKMLAYERTPYYINHEKNQRHELDLLKAERERQQGLFKNAFESSVADHKNDMPDTRAYLRYLSDVRTDLREKIDRVEAEMNDYKHNESSSALWLRAYLEFECEDALKPDMLRRLVRRIMVCVDGVEVDFEQT